MRTGQRREDAVGGILNANARKCHANYGWMEGVRQQKTIGLIGPIWLMGPIGGGRREGRIGWGGGVVSGLG